MTTVPAILVAIVLTFLGGLHIAWGHGSSWPASSGQALLALVIPQREGGNGPEHLPGRAACYGVAGALFAAAALVLAAERTLHPLATWGAWAVCAVFALRGSVGLFYGALFPARATTPFARMNLRYYSPLCILLAGMIACSVFFR